MTTSHDETRDLVYGQILLDLNTLLTDGSLQDAERLHTHHQLLLMQGGFPQEVCDAYEVLYGQIWGGIFEKKLASVQAKKAALDKRGAIIDAHRQTGSPGILRSPEGRKRFVDDFMRTYRLYEEEHGLAPSDKEHTELLRLTIDQYRYRRDKLRKSGSSLP